MSICGKIKNGFIYTPGEGSTYCCQDESDDFPLRQRFSLTDWEKKREYELSEFDKSRSEWLPQCYKCRINEEQFGSSMRVTNGDFMKHNFIRDVVLKTNNTCNLACRMCGPNLSTKWQSLLANGPQTNNYPHKSHSISDQEFEIMKNKVFTKHLRNLIISGGESLLSDYNRQAIEYLIDKDYAKNIILQITTNGTVLFRNNWLDAASKFKETIVEFSIDGTYESYEYIREGGSWDTLCDTIEDLYDRAPDVNFKINYVAQTLNAATMLHDTLTLWKLFKEKKRNVQLDSPDTWFMQQVSFCMGPDYLSYSSLAPVLRKKYNLDMFFTDLDNQFPFSRDCFRRFMKYNGHMDLATGKKLKDINSDFFNEKYYEAEDIDEYYLAQDKDKTWNVAQ